MKKKEMEPEMEQELETESPKETIDPEERWRNRLGKILSVLVLLVTALGVWLAGGDPFSVFQQAAESRPTSSVVNTESVSRVESVGSAGSVADSSQAPETNAGSGKLQVWFLDVGQADASLIRLPNGKTILIDAGESDGGEMILNFLKEQEISKIDYLVATHPHSDHIGGMRKVVEGTKIGKVYMPEVETNTTTYEKLLLAIAEKGRTVRNAKAGAVLFNEEGMRAEFVSPLPGEAKADDLNNASACLKLTYGKTSFLFMGDAEIPAEDKITMDVKADVIKVGHHGSDTSSGMGFVNRVQAKIAVISVGKGNDYGHPMASVINRWKKSGAEVWRTDRSGTVYVVSNGKKCEAFAWKDVK